MIRLGILLCIIFISTAYGLSIGSLESSSLLITPRVKRSDEEVKEGTSTGPTIYEMDVHTNVSNRYAKTLITTKVRNVGKEAQEARFSVVTPDQAFISGFVMEIDGKKYEAYVQEKEQAKQTYDRAVASGQAAGHVAVSARDSKRFTVEVNVQPESKVTFYLTYEELLKRDNNKYQIVLNIQPGQPVEKLEATVDIRETRKITFVDTPSLRSGNEILTKENEELKPRADIQTINDTATTVKFHPSLEDQKKFARELKTDPENGLQGQFIVEYDVERDPQGGEILVDEGYFVHFFAPSDLKPLPKKVVFVLDTSGSMSGTRIEQLKGAMYKVLDDLKTNDVFSIVEFNWIAKVWNVEKTAVQYESGKDDYAQENPEQVFRDKTNQPIPPPFPVTTENIKKAKRVVDKLDADGGTDIFSALTVALKIVEDTDDAHQPLIIFLTDGEATVGTTNNQFIISNITDANTGECPIFAISLGDGADRDFLQKIALKNSAFAKHIYEGADVSLQLEDYYRGISSPLLSNVTFKYTSELPDVKDVTKKKFGILFKGKEVVVAGRKGAVFEPPMVEAWSVDGRISLTPKVEKSAGSLERLWAYLTLKQLLEKKAVSEDKNITAEALKLALKYSFVSDVTSLVVVKPNVTKSVDLEDGSIARPLPFGGPMYSRLPSPNSFAAPSYGMAGPQRFALSSQGVSGQQYLLAARPYKASFQSSYQPSFGSGGFRAHPGRYFPRGPGSSFGGGFSSAGAPGSAGLAYPSASNIAAQSLEEADSFDLMVGPYPSTTFRPLPTTNIPLPTPPLSGIHLLKSRLPWLEAALNNNGSITLSSGAYDLGLSQPLMEGDVCTNPPTNATQSNCRLLDRCPSVYDVITTVQEYEKHFCILKGYAGICCPHD